MTEFQVPPTEGIIISDEDAQLLPLIAFHLVIIVEPDPESYMPAPQDLKSLGYIIYQMYERFETEIDPENPGAVNWAVPDDIDDTTFIWFRHYDEDVTYFKSFAETGFARGSFHFGDLDDTEHLLFYLKGVAAENPDWRVAVIGAVFEDEVIKVANIIKQVGFSTTVLTRYCLSSQAFVDLDNLFAYDQWVRIAARKEGEPFKAWFEEWMEEHGIDLDDEDSEKE